MAETKAHQIGDSQNSRANVVVRPSPATSVGNMADGIRAGIAVKRRVRGTANADRIENQDQSPWHELLGLS